RAIVMVIARIWLLAVRQQPFLVFAYLQALVLSNPSLLSILKRVLTRFQRLHMSDRIRLRYHPSIFCRILFISANLKYCTHPVMYCLSADFRLSSSHPLFREVSVLIRFFILSRLFGCTRSRSSPLFV